MPDILVFFSGLGFGGVGGWGGLVTSGSPPPSVRVPDVLVFFSGLGFGVVGGVGGLVTSGSPPPHVCSVRSPFMFLCGCLTYRLFFLRLLRACVKVWT